MSNNAPLTKSEHRRLLGFGVTVAAVMATAAAVFGSDMPPAPASAETTAVTVEVPRCVNDDFNDGTQALCYTVEVTTGDIVLIDATDEVVGSDLETE